MLSKLSKAAVTLALILYAMPVAAWLLSRALHGEQWWAIGYMNAVGIWWFAPLALLLPVALLVRARQATIVGAALLLPCLWLFGGDFLPNLPRSTSQETPTLTVMTFNTLWVNSQFEEVIARIRESDADVIGIQELAPEMDAAISDALRESHPYKLSNPWNDPRGIGMWSRYPMTALESRTYEGWEWWIHGALVEVEGRPVTIYNAHLWPIGTTDPEGFQIALAAQHTQVTELLALLEGVETPVILMGDFNASPTNEAYQRLDSVLDDAWRASAWGAGFTFPAPGSIRRNVPPFLRIDYVMWRGDMVPIATEVLERAGSDHLPVVSEFVLN